MKAILNNPIERCLFNWPTIGDVRTVPSLLVSVGKNKQNLE